MEFVAETMTTTKEYLRSNDGRKYQVEDSRSRAKRIVMYMVCGFLVGGVNGLFGAGGGMLAVPILSFVGGLSQRKSHATTILVMLPLCLASALVYTVSNAVDFEVLVPTAIGVLAGGIAGAKLLKVLPETLLFCVFNFLIITAGLKMLF